ncbi:MAG: rRNA pseudouridine synthase [Ignavibacteria bacterium]|nr:rRNA pseudouridine synthase [Ignavibacteria bacterium]
MNIATQTIRLNKFLSLAGITSRRNADELISSGKITVNKSRVTELGTKINPETDKVFYNGKQVVFLDKPIYIVFNKPKDCITTLDDEKGRTAIMDYVNVKQRVFPIGRLDRNTTGVLLLTNDGELANALMHPKHEIKKTYQVEIDKPLTMEDEKKLRQGIKLEDGMTSKSEVYILPKGKRKIIGISIHEGKNRQVRRMFESFGYEIEKLERVAYDFITCEGLKRGEWRYITEKEISILKSKAMTM